MRYFAMLAGTQRTVEVEPLGATRFRVTVDEGRPLEVDAEKLDGSVLAMLVNHRSIDADLDEDGDSVTVHLADETVSMELVDERRMRLKSAGGRFHQAGPLVIEAPMPGKIVKVLVPEGGEVAENQGVVVIEAMKMENELRAPRAGKVAKVFVREGQTVEGRARLVEIE